MRTAPATASMGLAARGVTSTCCGAAISGRQMARGGRPRACRPASPVCGTATCWSPACAWPSSSMPTVRECSSTRAGGHGKQKPNKGSSNAGVDDNSNDVDFATNGTNINHILASFGRGLKKACEKLVVSYASSHQKWQQDKLHRPQASNWVADDECARQVGSCRHAASNDGGLRGRTAGVDGSATLAPCCDPAGGRCQGPAPGTEERTHCQCNNGMTGDRCDTPCQRGCINDCSGHGTCWARWCLCDRGWFGMDCSKWGNASSYQKRRANGPLLPPPPPPPRHVSELRIYVYDVPAFVQHNEPCSSCIDMCGGLYDAATYFLSRLLRDAGRLTRDPGEAHLFYAPLRAYPISGNGMEVSRHIRDVLSVIRDMGYFDRSGGRDHVWWVQQDIGACKVTHLVRPGIIVGHYGRLDAWNEAGNHGAHHPPCVDPGKDLVVPAIAPASTVWGGGVMNVAGSVTYLQDKATAQAQAVFRDGWQHADRPTFLFFSGGNRPLVNPECADPGNDSATCRDMEYAMGIRAAIFAWFGENARGMGDVQISAQYANEQYYPKLRSSKFCLDVPGFGFSVRILDYVASGCIPVIVRDDILWPYESYSYGGDERSNWQQESPQGEWDDLPRVHYPEFAVAFRKKDIPTMLAALRNMTVKRVYDLQAGVQRVHKAFLWDHEYGLAYNYTLYGLTRLRAAMKL
eukprot:jgi/Mesvir1/19709/Mv09969-RA.2